MTTNRSGAQRSVNLAHFAPYIDPEDARRAAEYIGQNTTFSIVWTAADIAQLYVHDEKTPGGLIVGEAGSFSAIEARLLAIEAEMPDDVFASAAVAGTTLTVNISNGTAIPVDVSSLLDNVNTVPGVYAVTGGTTVIPLTNGASVTLDTNALASDAELAVVAAAEEYLANVVVSAAGVVSYITNLGNTAGTADIAAIIAANEQVLQQPTLAGTVATFPLQGGVSYTLDLATLNENLTDNGDGTVTWSDGDGGSFTFSTDTDDQLVTSPDGSVVVTPTILVGGQIDYTLATNASVSPATDPTGGGGTSVQDALDNIFAEVTNNTIQGVALSGDELVVTLQDGTTFTTDLDSVYATDAELAAAIGAIPADDVVNSVTLVGTNLLIGTSQGGSFTTPLTSLVYDESFVDNGDGSYTFTDDDGATVSFSLAAANETLTRRTTAGQTHLLDWDDKDGNTDTIHDASISTDAGNAIIRGTDDGLFAKNELVLVQEDIYTGVKLGWRANTLFTDHGVGKYLVTVTNANIEHLNTASDPYMRFSGQAVNAGVGLSGVSTVQVNTVLDRVNFESAAETRCIPRTTGAPYTIDDQSPYTMEAWVDWDGSSIHVRGTAIYQWTNGPTKPAKVSFYGSKVDANLTGVSFQHVDCRFNGAEVRVYKLS